VGIRSTITVNGSGFVTSSVISVGGADMSTTFRSPSQLTATLDSIRVAKTGQFTVRVTNPPPGGGTSATFSVQVRNPTPKITLLIPATMAAGSADPTIQVTGSGFAPGSVVQVNGAPRTTTFVTYSLISASLSDDDLKQPGTATITVQNPSPGGGLSSASTLPIAAVPPVLSRIPISGGAAGRGGFSFTVDGRQFTASSVVTWNGSDRPTTYVSRSRLTVSLSAADVAAATTGQVAVRTPGVAPSQPLPFVVRAVPAASLTSVFAIHLPAQDVVYDAITDRLYATIGPTGAQNANLVIAVDPHTGSITGSVFVGTDPKRIVLSDDGKFLYVTLSDNTQVRRVQVSPLAAQLQFTPSTGTAVRVGDLAVVPGADRALAVIRTAGGYPQDIRIFDDDQPRPKSAIADFDRLAFGDDAGTLYGIDTQTSEGVLATLSVDVSGVSTNVTRTVTTIALVGLQESRSAMYAAGRLYHGAGSIIDPERAAIVGSVSDTRQGPMSVDPALGRAYFVNVDAIHVYDLSTAQLLGSIPLPPNTLDGLGFFDHRLIRAGGDLLAVATGGGLYVFRAPLFAP
jgi:hypothetical protein